MRTSLPLFALMKASMRPRAFLAFAGFLLLTTLMVGLRLFALNSDPYRNLDWSSGLLTDEGFYLHNARNVILFGHSQTDDFNNSLLSPTLNAIQIAVFRRFGMGIAQARLISVAAGLLTLTLFFAALRRAYSVRLAALATVFLGLDHVPLLYSRMALMDTPAALILTAAFYFWVRANPSSSPKLKCFPLLWLFLCGATLGLAFTTRGLCAFAIPVPLLVLCRRRRGDKIKFQRPFTFIFGLALVLTLYVSFWLLPHRVELAQTNGFYLHQQLLPRSFGHFVRIITRSFFGDTRGIAPALIRHTPLLFGLALAGAWWRFSVRRGAKPLSENTLYLGGWLVSGLLTFGAVGYAPSRYYILFFPALAAVAALSTQYLPEVTRFLSQSQWRRALFGGFFAYHFFLFIRPVSGLSGNIFVGALTLCATLLFWFLPRAKKTNSEIEQSAGAIKPKSKIQNPKSFASFFPVVLLWAVLNALWLDDWMTHLAYSQRNVEHWLTANLPLNAVLIGDAAPGMSVNTGFISVPVIPGLCNDNRPIERFADRPRVIIILDGNRREAWWDKRYPTRITPANRVLYFPDSVGFPVGIYLLPPENMKSPLKKKNHLKRRSGAGN